MMSLPAVEFTATVELLDGRRVSLRPLRGDDAEAVAALHRNLSSYDRFLRFFTLSPAHLDELVRMLIEPAAGQYALGAFDVQRLVGVANFAVSDDPTVADIAILVAHEDHLCGVGTALLRCLAEIAENQGIRRFVADILADNRLMFKVISDLGWPYERSSCGPVCRLEFELPQHRPGTISLIEVPQQGA
jgi:RimJ/RimL family protein N-acetyltransferase